MESLSAGDTVHYRGRERRAGCLKSAALAARERLEAGSPTHPAAAIKMRNYDLNNYSRP